MIALRQSIDARHYPARSDARDNAMADLGKPQGSITATPGRFDASNNAHINSVLRRAGSPAPRSQPSAGQLIGAKIITGQ